MPQFMEIQDPQDLILFYFPIFFTRKKIPKLPYSSKLLNPIGEIYLLIFVIHYEKGICLNLGLASHLQLKDLLI